MKLKYLDLHPSLKAACSKADLCLEVRGDTTQLVLDTMRFLEHGALKEDIELKVCSEVMAKVRRQAMMRVIHIAWFQSKNEQLSNRIWALQDGYGEPGYTPPQGYDWSGIRDSSAQAVQAMYKEAIHG